MRPVCLQLKGFTSFKDETTVSFTHLDRFVVCGPTGAGKSSLFDALTFALFAIAPRVDTGNLSDLVSLGRKSFSVTLDFTVGQRQFRVMRTRSRNGVEHPDQLLEMSAAPAASGGRSSPDAVCKSEPLATGAKAVTEAVEKLLGLSYVHFIQSVFLPQGKFAELLRSRPSVRRKLLNELLRLLVFERMREAAGREREGNTARTQETERRLREDFAGVSIEALQRLSEQLAAQQQIMSDADRRLPELRHRSEEARCNHDWTTELDARQQDLARHAARQPEIDLAQGELEAALRAAQVVPQLEQLASLESARDERQTSLTQAGTTRDRCRQELEQARQAHRQAASSAAPLPELRRRLERLTLAVGKLSLLHKLMEEIEQHLGRHEALLQQKSTCADNLARLTQTIADWDKTLRTEQADLALVGYDAERHRRLEAVRDNAFRLRSERERLIAALRLAEQIEARAEQAELAAAQAAAAQEHSVQARQQALRQHGEAETLLRAAEEAHKAIHLRSSLQTGQPCPVCLHKVGKVPATGAVPELTERQQAWAQAQSRLTMADSMAAQATANLTAARAAADAALQQASVARTEANDRQHAIDLLQGDLLNKVGDLFQPELRRGTSHHMDAGEGNRGSRPQTAMPAFLAWADDPPAPAAKRTGRRKKDARSPSGAVNNVLVAPAPRVEKIEEQILASLQHIGQQAQEHRRLHERVAEQRSGLVLKQKEMETLQAEIARHTQDLEKTAAKLAQDRQALAQAQADIQKAAGTSDPVSESARVRTEIDNLQHLLAATAQTETEADRNWQIAEARACACAAELAAAQTRADGAERQAREAMAQTGFADAVAVRRAARSPEQQQALRDRIAGHAAALHTLQARIAELQHMLQGRRVLREDWRLCEQAHSECQQARQQAQTQAVLLERQHQTMTDQLVRAQQLQAELARQERLQQTYDQLARDLRSDNFQAFLLEETLAGLVRDASVQLMRLTGDRYGLLFEEERIFVIDNDNAGEQRGIETLSGGETFLASLALALALSDQVQKIAGAVHLDCLFIDEGFGALDPETLRTVSDTIRALQVGGRMVGVITHVPELKEEFDQRILVDRKEGTSQVRLEIC